MTVFVLYFFIAMLVLAFQAVLCRGIKPDSVFILVFFYALRYGHLKGMGYGALTGMLIDVTSGFILGPHIISKAFTGYIVTSIRQKVFQWNVIINTITIAFLSVIDILLVYICFETFANISAANVSLKTSFLQVVYTTVISMIVYPALNPEKEDSLSSLTI